METSNHSFWDFVKLVKVEKQSASKVAKSEKKNLESNSLSVEASN